jgi:D-amino-acid oxidase
VEQEYDRITYGRLAKISKEHPDLVEEIPFYDVWETKTDEAGQNPWYKDLVPGFTVLHDKKSNTKGLSIPGNFSKGTTFRSYITNAPNYLAWLSQECKKRGIPMVRHRLSALDQAYDLYALGLSKEKGKTVNLVINCSALGARSLIGVEDESV